MAEIKAKVWSVGKLNRYIRSLLEDDVLLGGLFCEAEISNLKYHSSGHVYFSCKDETGQISCVMWRSAATALKFRLADGMRVILYGAVKLYEKTGQYQLNIEIIEPLGKGSLYAAFEQLKQKLDKEGLFSAGRKRPIPEYTGCVAVVSSPTGAVIRDIINVSRRRNPYVKLVLFPAVVQGDAAPASIISALSLANEWGGADVIVIARGGGSLEDLWAFNDEQVVRAVASSKTPVISAIGHQTDFTLCDFAADLRAETPSSAAELAVYDYNLLKSMVDGLAYALSPALSALLRRKRERLTVNAEWLGKSAARYMNGARREIEEKLAWLELLSPAAILKRGYAAVYSGGSLVKSTRELTPGCDIRIKFADGEAYADIKEVKYAEEGTEL